jgi:toxin-antitoxin system PIN domain toxin
MDIPDVNVWLALVDQNHLHHNAAASYWENTAATQVAFTRVSMMGFLRLGTQPRVLSRTLTPPEAWELYRQFLADPNHCLLQEPASLDHHFAALTTQPKFLKRPFEYGLFWSLLAGFLGIKNT